MGLLASLACVSTAQAADAPSPKLALSFKPIQQDVEYDIPEGKSIEACKVQALREGKTSGWTVLGPAGQLLRRFMDTDADGNVDQFSYYRNGIEVYRDIDSNGNNKVDQSRWVNIGGSRWGVDANEDGRIDSWKKISAEETGRQAVKALIAQDATIIAPLLITKDDLKLLGIEGDIETKILNSVADPGAKLKKAIANSKLITPRTTFLRFDSASPGTVPADQWKSKTDISVYENAMAIVDPGNKPGLVQIGEMVRVGDVWKLTTLPVPLEGDQIEVAFGHLVAPDLTDSAGTATVTATGLSDEAKQLIKDLEEVDKNIPAPDASKREHARHNVRRADILAKLRKAASTDELREQFLRQEVDGITAGVQFETFPDGVARLRSLEVETLRSSPKSPLSAYIVYRRMLAEHSIEIQAAGTAEERGKIQDKWLKIVEDYVNAYPLAEDSADASLQLGIANEFSGKVDPAKKWYNRVVKDFPKSQSFAKAEGALRRMELTGKFLTLSGSGLTGGTVDVKEFRGKTLLVIFWATWCKPCTEDLPLIKGLYSEYRSKGFEILGVNLDEKKADVEPYLRKFGATWPQIYSPGSLDSAPAREFGVISLPTMFLVDEEGKVVNRAVSVADLKTYLSEKK